MGTIAIVEDESLLNEILAETLREQNHLVLQTIGGDEALQLLFEKPVDLVISDICMPKGNGLSLLMQVKEADIEHPAFIMCTGLLTVPREDVFHMGGEGLLLKPYDLTSLRALVDRLIQPIEKRFCLNEDAPVNIPEFPLTHLSFKESILNKEVAAGRGGLFIPTEFTPRWQNESQIRVNFKDGPVIGNVLWSRGTESTRGQAGFGFEITHLTESMFETFREKTHSKIKPYIPKYL